jgi:DNA modification methylase
MQLMLGDCLTRMAEITDGSVDMVLCDLPYGTTQNKWDAVIPFDALWQAYGRVCKPNAAIVLTAAQPFTSALVMSNPRAFRYDWTWRKPRGTGHLNAKKQPMRDKEDILVFSHATPAYNPQFAGGTPYRSKSGAKGSTNYGADKRTGNDNDGRRYPRQVIEFGVVERDTLHPTQKPVALMEYLIRTYTHEGETVLDNTMGSGTTGVACANTNRSFIGIERDPAYFAIAERRIHEAMNATPLLMAAE